MYDGKKWSEMHKIAEYIVFVGRQSCLEGHLPLLLNFKHKLEDLEIRQVKNDLGR